MKSPASFRDPAGFVFFQDGQPFRCVSIAYADEFELLKSSGLLRMLHDRGELIGHEEVAVSQSPYPDAYAVLRVDRVETVSYPYEWSFSQLKDAALLTLQIQRKALDHGMALKDASAYNVQFHKGRPVFIDTLSFERYVDGEPWVAYRQFCQHFLAPLALVAFCGAECGRLSQVFLDGVPVSTAAKMLPVKARLNLGLALHVFAHAKSSGSGGGKARMGRTALLGLIDSLRSTVESLGWKPGKTTWSDYYRETNYSALAMESKRQAVREALSLTRPECVWDLGANTGEFSALAAVVAKRVVAWDMDPLAVDLHYRDESRSASVLPLIVDLSNPSAAIGWASEERDSFLGRSDVDLALALALVHHLAIGNNVPFERIASFLSQIARHLVIEFVPKEDSQVQRMLASRKDVFDEYDADSFLDAFSKHFAVHKSWPVADSLRTVYLMERA